MGIQSVMELLSCPITDTSTMTKKNNIATQQFRQFQNVERVRNILEEAIHHERMFPSLE